MDKKTQIIHLVFACILVFCTTINIIRNYRNIPEWLNVLTGIFMVAAFVLLIVVVIRIIKHRKSK